MLQKIKNSYLADLSKSHIPSLDGIRALAISIVFLAHAGLDIVPGALGVNIFFFLSGYLITTLLRREFEKNHTINLKHFYLRRVIRIWPSFYFVLFLGVGLTLLELIPGKIELKPALAQALHFANYYSISYGWDGMTLGSGVFWSLAVEEHFYLIFPFIYLFALKIRLSPKHFFLFLVVLCCLILGWRYYLFNALEVTKFRTLLASDTRFDSILFGCMLAIYGNPYTKDAQLPEFKVKYIYLPLAFLTLIFTLFYRSEIFRETLRYTLQGIALFPFFIAAIRFPHWGLFKCLNYHWVRFIGVLSYPFYLVHYTVIHTLDHFFEGMPRITQGLIALFISLLLAYITHIAIEIPFRNLRNKLG